MATSDGRAANPRGLGFAAAAATVTIWASFLVISRYAVTGSFTVAELLFLRLAPAALVLAPWMLRLGVLPRGLTPWRAVVLIACSGVGFPAIIMIGLTYAPASDAGPLAPGTLPFWTALAAWALMGEVPGPRRRLGLVLILAGAAMVSLWQIAAENHPGAWRGHLLFLSAGMAWGLYTVVFRQSGLTPLQGLCIGIFWSIVVIGPVLLWIGLPFADAGWAEISVMAVLQGLLMTVLALLLYGIAVTRLGAAETGAFGALTPILAMLGGALFLQEEIGPLKIAGVAVVAVGVILASGILTRQRTRPDPAPVD